MTQGLLDLRRGPISTTLMSQHKTAAQHRFLSKDLKVFQIDFTLNPKCKVENIQLFEPRLKTRKQNSLTIKIIYFQKALTF